MELQIKPNDIQPKLEALILIWLGRYFGARENWEQK